jgi:hypothetical protein
VIQSSICATQDNLFICVAILHLGL